MLPWKPSSLVSPLHTPNYLHPSSRRTCLALFSSQAFKENVWWSLPRDICHGLSLATTFGIKLLLILWMCIACVHAWGVVCDGCLNMGLHVPVEARYQLQISFLLQQHQTCFLKQGLLQEPRAHQVDWAGPGRPRGLPMSLVLKLQLPHHTQLLPIVEKELGLLHL